MTHKHRIVFLLYPECESLDFAGPASVFHAANGRVEETIYTLQYVALNGEDITTNAGLTVRTKDANSLRLGARDTLIVPGAESLALSSELKRRASIDLIQRLATNSGRVASVCSGAFLLAESGLLDNRRATTHWEATSDLKARYPAIKVEPDALYTVDDNIWTSAGVSTGIDMALAMVKHDLGSEIMRGSAQRLVVHSQRAGSQSQFSTLLKAQASGNGEFSDLISWMNANMRNRINVAGLAQRCAISERNFHRKFTKVVGQTPAKFLDGLRMQHAKELLDAGQMVKAVTIAVGYGSESGFRNAFEAYFGLSPSVYGSLNNSLD